jgi:hypothetical protein
MRNAALAAVLVAACSSSSDAPRVRHVDDETAARLLIDRNWIDRMPQTARDQLHVYRFVPSMGGGVYQDRTLFKGTFELFTYDVEGNRIDIFTPEDHERHVTGFHVDEVSGPAPFDIRLTLDRAPRGPRVYYSVKSQTATDTTALDAALRALISD